jgi:hypothetical protein
MVRFWERSKFGGDVLEPSSRAVRTGVGFGDRQDWI